MSLGDVEISRKTSLALSLSEKYEENRKTSTFSDKGKEPKDVLLLVHILCFFIGFMSIMPMLFFNTAQGYWMYKFRNTSIDSESTKGSDRTMLQSYYQSISQAAGTVANIIFTTLFTFYGHKWSSMMRSIISLSILCTLFIIFAIFTQVDSDSWQTGFFVLTMLMLVVNSAAMATFQMASVILVAKLHHNYTFLYLIGQNGSLLTTLLQIVSLSVTDKNVISGLIYFSAGAFLIGFTLVLLLLGRRSKIFMYYNVENFKDQKSEHMSWEESKTLLKQIWPCVILPCIALANLTCIHPAISTLIVSENDGDGTEWTTKYFTPVVIFLLTEASSIMGRIASKGFLVTHSNKWFYIVAVILKAAITIPFFVFSNAQPRHLPVIFDRDWEVMIGTIFNGFTFGFIFSVAFMSVKPLSNNKQETGLKLITFMLSLVLAATSANGIIMVKLL